MHNKKILVEEIEYKLHLAEVANNHSDAMMYNCEAAELITDGLEAGTITENDYKLSDYSDIIES